MPTRKTIKTTGVPALKDSVFLDLDLNFVRINFRQFSIQTCQWMGGLMLQLDHLTVIFARV